MKMASLLLALALYATALPAQNRDMERTPASYFLIKGEKQVNLSVGFLNPSSFAFSLFGATGAGDPSPSLNLEFDYGLTDAIAIGFHSGFYRVNSQQSTGLDNISDGLSDLGLDGLLSGVFSQLGIDNLLCETLGVQCAKQQVTRVQERINVFSLGGKLMFRKHLFPEVDTYASTYLGYSFNKRKTITESALDAISRELGLNTQVPELIYYGSLGLRYYLTPQLGLYGEYGRGNVHLLKVGISYKIP